MKLDNIDIEAKIKEVETFIKNEKNISPAVKAMFDVLLLIVTLLLSRLGLNSSNSSKPPSTDPNRKKKKKSNGNKTGGQKGHIGTTLKQVDEPDEIEILEIDRRALPKDHTYVEVGFEKRQVFDIYIAREVTEYQAQILADENGNRYVASFPENVTKAVQYGSRLKAHCVYMSQYQLLPYNRIQEYFKEQLQIPISQGSIFNFNLEAYKRLESFEQLSKQQLTDSTIMHADETGINIDGKRHWLHCLSNLKWTYFLPHEKRGVEAMDEMDIIPRFTGILIHDHWKPYYRYEGCLHALCNAHHIRELNRVTEQDKQVWADKMKTFLEQLNCAVHDAGGYLNFEEVYKYQQVYRELLKEAEIECPPPDESLREEGKRGKLKRSKARNLLERLIEYEDDVLRFMENPDVPFTNNQGENDIRMTKVQQKISGCFRSMDGSKIFCRVRGYLSTCKKQGVSSAMAMDLLFQNKLPDFCNIKNHAE